MSLHDKMLVTLLLVLIIFLLLLNLVYDIKEGGQNRKKNILFGRLMGGGGQTKPLFSN